MQIISNEPGCSDSTGQHSGIHKVALAREQKIEKAVLHESLAALMLPVTTAAVRLSSD